MLEILSKATNNRILHPEFVWNPLRRWKLRLQAGLCLMTLTMAASLATQAQSPTHIGYQGKVEVNNKAFTGQGQFKFVLLSATDEVRWSHDGTGLNGQEPQSFVTLQVQDGYYAVRLGDPEVAGMTPIAPQVTQQGVERLRIWFNDGVHGFEQLTPDHVLSSVPYAMSAGSIQEESVASENLVDGAVTEAKLAADSVNGSHVQDGTLTGADLAADSITAEHVDQTETLRVRGLKLVNADNTQAFGYLYASGGSDSSNSDGGSFVDADDFVIEDQDNGGLDLGDINLSGPGIGVLSLYNPDKQPQFTAIGTGKLELKGADGTIRVLAENHEGVGGRVLVYQTDGDKGVYLKGDSSGAGAAIAYNSEGQNGAVLDGEGDNSGGELRLYDGDGDETVRLTGARNGDHLGSLLEMRNGYGEKRVTLAGQSSDGASYMEFFNASGERTVKIDARDGNGAGRITTQVLEITGGSDLSEQFDVNADSEFLQPGLVVSIDPSNPGELVPSTTAYDPTVAGIISGAGGVKPGMLMGQTGSIADGKYPVALTGRVYCKVDATEHPIKPGDLITTSNTPGHGMKVTDAGRAHGAILGKAMTSLDSGKGLVLVLVSLH